MKPNKDIGPSIIYNLVKNTSYKEATFQFLVRKLLVFKQSFISLLPNYPKEVQRSCSPRLFSFPPNKGVMPS